MQIVSELDAGPLLSQVGAIITVANMPYCFVPLSKQKRPTRSIITLPSFILCICIVCASCGIVLLSLWQLLVLAGFDELTMFYWLAVSYIRLKTIYLSSTFTLMAITHSLNSFMGIRKTGLALTGHEKTSILLPQLLLQGACVRQVLLPPPLHTIVSVQVKSLFLRGGGGGEGF